MQYREQELMNQMSYFQLVKSLCADIKTLVMHNNDNTELK
jgi:hypothetical protein